MKLKKEILEKAWDLVHNKYPENNDEIQLVRYAIKTAMELTERDTPKKPFVNILNGVIEYNCGVCVCSLDIPQLEELNFCPECGNRIDWSE